MLAAINANVAAVAWLIYGLMDNLVAVWLVSLLALIPGLMTAFLLRRTLRTPDALIALAWVAVVTMASVSGRGALSFVLAGAVLVTCGPTLWSAYRTARPAGLTSWTWVLALADASTWGLYGVVLGDRALEMYGVVLLSTAVAMLLRLRITSGREAPVLAR